MWESRMRVGCWFGFAGQMARFLVEHYLPGSTHAERSHDVALVGEARHILSTCGTLHVSSLIVDADEMCMHVYDAEAESMVLAAHDAAGLRCDRIVEVRMPRLAVATA